MNDIALLDHIVEIVSEELMVTREQILGVGIRPWEYYGRMVFFFVACKIFEEHGVSKPKLNKIMMGYRGYKMNHATLYHSDNKLRWRLESGDLRLDDDVKKCFARLEK